MNLAMVDTTQRNNEFIAHLPAHGSRLHEAKVMGIGMLSPTNKTWLFGDEPQMFLIAMTTRLHNRKSALVDSGRILRLDGHRRSWRRF
jgi:hypothetical protein